MKNVQRRNLRAFDNIYRFRAKKSCLALYFLFHNEKQMNAIQSTFVRPQLYKSVISVI